MHHNQLSSYLYLMQNKCLIFTIIAYPNPTLRNSESANMESSSTESNVHDGDFDAIFTTVNCKVFLF